MSDFDRSDYKLTEANRKTLDLVDEAIEGFRVLEKPLSQVRLYAWQWAKLDHTLRTQSNYKVSLDTHTYRGTWLIT